MSKVSLIQTLKLYAFRPDGFKGEISYSCGVPSFQVWHLQSSLAHLPLQMGDVGSEQAESPWWSGSIYRQTGQNNNVL